MLKFVRSSNRNNHFKSLMHLCISQANSTSTTTRNFHTIDNDFHSIDKDFESFSKIQDDVVFQGWRKIVRRKLQMPNGNIKDFDILSTATSIVVFTWDSSTKTTTLIQEYHPGIERALYGTGIFNFIMNTYII